MEDNGGLGVVVLHIRCEVRIHMASGGLGMVSIS